MISLTHIAIGSLAWTAIGRSTSLVKFANTLPRPAHVPFLFGHPIDQLLMQPRVALALVALGSILPGIDNPLSRFGWQVPLISLPISMIFGVRGFSHSLLVSVVLLALALMSPIGLWSLPFVVGYLCHLVCDALTREGLPLLWPSPRTFGLGIIPTATLSDFALLAAALFGNYVLRFGWPF